MTDLHCNEFVELVTAFLEDALGAEGQRRFVEHVALCDGCDRYLDQFRQTIRTLQDVHHDSLSEDSRSALLTAFRNLRS